MKQSIQKIILFAAFFAAGLSNISANAQESVGVATPAMAEVWTKPGYTAMSGTTSIDFDMTIPEIYNAHSTETDYTNAAGMVFLGAGIATNEECPSVGLCYSLDGMTVFLKAGDSVELGAADAERNANSPIVRVYTTNPGGELAFAQYSGTVGVAESGEFYLDDNWEETDIGAARGFVPVQCSAGFISNDDITCECPAGERVNAEGSCETIPANCGEFATNDPENVAMCVCDADHRFVEGSTTMCEPNSEDNMEETEMEEMETEMEESQNQQPQPQNNGSGRPKEFAYIGAGVFIVGFAASYIAGGGFPIFNYSPDFGYSLTESGYSANVGGRADFRKDNWHLYYTAKQTNSGGEFADFRYTSGGEYKNDLFAAAFSESVAGETANYNFSLSADVDGRLVDFSPVYRLHSEYDKGKFSTRNELNLQGNFRYDGWTINSSAGFRWENTKDFAENARFQINAIHRF